MDSVNVGTKRLPEVHSGLTTSTHHLTNTSNSSDEAGFFHVSHEYPSLVRDADCDGGDLELQEATHTAVKSEILSDEESCNSHKNCDRAILQDDQFSMLSHCETLPRHDVSIETELSTRTDNNNYSSYKAECDEMNGTDSGASVKLEMSFECETSNDYHQPLLSEESKISLVEPQIQSPLSTNTTVPAVSENDFSNVIVKSEEITCTPEEILSHNYYVPLSEDITNSTEKKLLKPKPHLLNSEVKSEVLYNHDPSALLSTNADDTKTNTSHITNCNVNSSFIVKSEIQSETEDSSTPPVSPTIEIDTIKSECSSSDEDCFPPIQVSFGKRKSMGADKNIASISQSAYGDTKKAYGNSSSVWSSPHLEEESDNDELAPVDRLVSQAFSSSLNTQQYQCSKGQSTINKNNYATNSKGSFGKRTTRERQTPLNKHSIVIDEPLESTKKKKGAGSRNHATIMKEDRFQTTTTTPSAPVENTDIQSQSGLTTFKCSVCGKECKFYFCLNLPATNKKVEITYKCPTCVRLTAHQSAISNNSSGNVNSNSGGSSNSSSSKGHGRKNNKRTSNRNVNNSSSQSSSNSGCDTTTTTSSKSHNMFSNVITMSGLGKKVYKCLDCQKEFHDSWELNCHAAVHHSRHKKVFTCPVCDKGYSTSLGFQEHMKVHLASFSSSTSSSAV